MLGRQNKELILRLLKNPKFSRYQIVVVRRRSKGNARLDRMDRIPKEMLWER